MTTFVAEFTTNHMGNLNVLLRMVERAAWAGCDLIKMQKKDVETFYSPEKLDSPYDSPYGKTYRDYRSTFEFDRDDFDRFNAACEALGVEWFSTVQDLPSLDFMLDYELRRYKVASCNARNRDLLREMEQRIPRDRTVVISVAGSTLAEIDASLETFPHHDIWLQHCVARYPCPPDQLRLGNVEALKRQFGDERITIGYSGHEEGIAASQAAIDLGADVVERHFCLSRHSFVHHIECSLEPEEFHQLVMADRRGRVLGEGCDELPEAAYATYFGMTPTEERFLRGNTYGRKFLGDHSEFLQEDEVASIVSARPRPHKVAA